MLLTIALGGFIVAFTVAIIRYLRFKAYFDRFPGLEDFRWSTGNLHEFKVMNEEGIAYHEKFAAKHPYFYRAWYGPLEPFIYCIHPEFFKAVVKAGAPKIARGRFLNSGYDMGLPWIGEGLVLARGEGWKRNRKLLTPAFHFDTLKKYLEVFNKAGDTCVRHLSEVTKDGKSVNIQEKMSIQTLDVLLQCGFSRESGCQENSSDYVHAIKELTVLWIDRFRKPSLWNDFVYSFTANSKRFQELCDFVHGVADDVIKKRQKELESQHLENVKVKDFLDILLVARDEEGKGMSHTEIRSEVDTFLFAGHDTTAMALTFFLYTISQHPEEQEKCYEEICEVLGDRETVTWSDLNKLEYLTMCVKESIRLNPSIPEIARRLDEPLTFQGNVFPKGTAVMLQLYLLQRNPSVWENPNEFRPERFHPDNVKDHHPFQFVPFSAGSRNCIGQNFAMHEIKTLVAKLLKKFTVSLDEKVKVRRIFSIAINTENGINVFLKPRN